MVGMFVSLCLPSQNSSEREFYVPAGSNIGVKLLKYTRNQHLRFWREQTIQPDRPCLSIVRQWRLIKASKAIKFKQKKNNDAIKFSKSTVKATTSVSKATGAGATRTTAMTVMTTAMAALLEAIWILSQCAYCDVQYAYCRIF